MEMEILKPEKKQPVEKPPTTIEGTVVPTPEKATVAKPEKAPRAPRAKKAETTPAPKQPERTGAFSEHLDRAKARRENLRGRISGAFSGIREKLAKGGESIVKGADYTAAGATWFAEKVPKAGDRLADGILKGAEKCDNACKKGREKTMNALQTVGNKAKEGGVRLNATGSTAWNGTIAWTSEQLAKLADRSKAKNEKKIAAIKAESEPKIAALRTEANEREKEMNRQIAEFGGGVDAAKRSAEGFRDISARRREKIKVATDAVLELKKK